MASDFTTPFLIADASDIEVGGVLMQCDEKDIEQHVCYFYRKFNSHQKNYSTMEKEALALLLVVLQFDVAISEHYYAYCYSLY